MLFYTPLKKSLPVLSLYWSWAHLLLTLSYNVRNSDVHGKTTKYIDAEIACFGSLLQLLLYQSLINNNVIYTKSAHFLLIKFDILCQQKKNTALWGLWTRYIALNSQISLRGKVDTVNNSQSVEHYMEAMVPGKLYYFFKLETFISLSWILSSIRWWIFKYYISVCPD